MDTTNMTPEIREAWGILAEINGSSLVSLKSSGGLDTDNDNLYDIDEILEYNTDPQNNDTDGDSYNDGDEIKNGYDPLDPNDPEHINDEPDDDEPDDDGNDGDNVKEEISIPLGKSYLIFIIISVIYLVIVRRHQIIKKFK